MSELICNPCAEAQVCLDNLDRYSLQSETFYFVLNCPPNFFCGGNNVMYLVCCDGTIEQTTFTAGMTAAQRQAAISALVGRCLMKDAFCGGTDTFPNPGDGTNGNHPGNDPNNPLQLYGNRPMSSTSYCADGSPFTYTVPAGLFYARTQALADAAALNFARTLSSSLKICLTGPLRTCCNRVAYSSTMVASGGVPGNFRWAVIGSLPTGLVAIPIGHNGLRIQGIPTTNGNYTFVVRATDSSGNFMAKIITIKVWGITDATLPDGTLAADYDYQLTTTNGTAPYVYTLIGGGFPLGVDITSGGLITGVVGEVGVFNPTIKVTDNAGRICSKTFELTCVPGTDVYAYFKCDETAGVGIVDSVSGITLIKSTLAFPTEPGFIGTSVRIGAYPADPFFKAANYYTPLADASHWDFSTSSWTIRLWANVSGDTAWLASALSTPDQFRILWLNTGNVEFTALLGAGWETITVPMAASAWHRVIAWYEKGVGLGLMIDDGLPTLAINTNLIGSGNQRLLIGGPLGYGIPPAGFSTIDEVAIWNRMLTNDEITYDWNSGAGRTYPDIP